MECQMSPVFKHPEAVVSTQWLGDNLADPLLRIFECTTYLLYRPPGSDRPYDVGSGREDYEQGHIPGAGFLDLQNDLSDNDAPAHLRFRMLPAERLAAAFARQGVGDDYRIILYARGAMQWATRVWWMLRSIGFDNAAVLDGGWEKWLAEERAVSADPVRFAATSCSVSPRDDIFVGKEQVLEAMDAGHCVVNALAPDLHSGRNARYGRAGRIPGSVNLPASALLDPLTNAFVSANGAQQAFDAVGVDPQGPTLVYCGGGIAATLDAFLMHQLGHQGISIYDASMSEWAKDDSLPIESDVEDKPDE
jgi:thiosulfate/3-mercaptopyruvate sulfurtransferase